MRFAVIDRVDGIVDIGTVDDLHLIESPFELVDRRFDINVDIDRAEWIVDVRQCEGWTNLGDGSLIIEGYTVETDM